VKVKVFLALTALTVALLAPASAHAGRKVPGMAGQTPIDVTTTTGHANYDDPTIVDHLVGLINRTPSGSAILTNVYQTEAADLVVTALRYAKEARGVNVWVTYGAGGDSPSGAFDWVNWNTPNGETRMRKCLTGCHNTSNPDGKAHSKYFLFYTTQRAPGGPLEPAVWISSANLNRGSGSLASNLSVTFYNDADMWWGMWGVWMDGFNKDPANGDYYRPHLGWQQPHSGIVYSARAGSVAHISPDDDGGDMWANQLRPLSGGPNCVVRLMQAQISDARLDAVREVRRLANAGCAVRVLLGYAPDGSADIGTQARSLLCNAPNTLMRKRARLHDKGVQLHGTYEGTPGRYQVFAGSHNWTGNALRDNDEVLLRVSDSEDAYVAFYDHFYDIWHSSLTSGLSGCA
jgi:hypothetical protein